MHLPGYPRCGYMKCHNKISGLHSHRNEIRFLNSLLSVKPHSAEFLFLTELTQPNI